VACGGLQGLGWAAVMFGIFGGLLRFVDIAPFRCAGRTQRWNPERAKESESTQDACMCAHELHVHTHAFAHTHKHTHSVNTFVHMRHSTSRAYEYCLTRTARNAFREIQEITRNGVRAIFIGRSAVEVALFCWCARPLLLPDLVGTSSIPSCCHQPRHQLTILGSAHRQTPPRCVVFRCGPGTLAPGWSERLPRHPSLYVCLCVYVTPRYVGPSATVRRSKHT
jgi:hypothetical protein